MFTVKEVAEKLRVSSKLVLRMGREGRLPMVEVGPKSFRIPEHAVELILSGNNVAKQQ